MTPASPHPATPEPSCVSGAVLVNDPSACCASVRSSAYLLRNDDMSMLNVDVSTKAAMSPVQPSRSLRLGQSVGTASMLDRWPHTIACCTWLSRVLEVVRVPSCGAEVQAVRPVRDDSVGVPGKPVTST